MFVATLLKTQQSKVRTEYIFDGYACPRYMFLIYLIIWYIFDGNTCPRELLK